MKITAHQIKSLLTWCKGGIPAAAGWITAALVCTCAFASIPFAWVWAAITLDRNKRQHDSERDDRALVRDTLRQACRHAHQTNQRVKVRLKNGLLDIEIDPEHTLDATRQLTSDPKTG